MQIESVRYDAVADFILTIAAAGSHHESNFWWPHTNGTQMWLAATAVHNLDPGQEFRMSTRNALPTWLSRDRSNAEFEFHGTVPEFIPSIVANGFTGTLGGGSTAIAEVYGLLIPQVFTSNLVGTAKNIPTNVCDRQCRWFS